MNRRILEVAQESLKAIAPEDAAMEPIHRLFYERLIELPEDIYPGGRFKKFYHSKRFDFPNGGFSAMGRDR